MDFIFLKTFKDFKDPWGPCYSIFPCIPSVSWCVSVRCVFEWLCVWKPGGGCVIVEDAQELSEKKNIEATC